MLTRSYQLTVFSTCLLAGILFVSGCTAKRHATRSSRSAGRVLHNITPENITPEQDYNPSSDADSIPLTPPAPRDSDPPPPTRNTSDLPPAPPSDDFESAERPGRHSASFGPYTGRVQTASKWSATSDAKR